MLKKLVILFAIGCLFISCGGEDEPTVCEQASAIAQDGLNTYCSDKKCCWCTCWNRRIRMVCNGRIWACESTPYYTFSEYGCPDNDAHAAECLEDTGKCFQDWYQMAEQYCEEYP